LLFVAIIGKDAFSPGSWHKSFAVRLGLDLSSGTTVTLQAVTAGNHVPPASSMQRALEIIRERVNGLGISEAQVTQQGNDIIDVAVPGVNQQRVVTLVGKTAKLRFRQVMLEELNTPGGTPSAAPSGTAPASTPSPQPSSTSAPSPTASGHALGSQPPGGQALAGGARVLAGAATPSPTAPAPSGSAAASPPGTPAPTTPPTSPAGQFQGQDTSGISAAVLATFVKLDCSNPRWQQQVGYNPNTEDDPKAQIVACSQDHSIKYVLDVAKVEGTDVTGASSGLPNTGSSVGTQWQVNLTFNATGTKDFGDLTTAMYNKFGTSANPPPRDQLAIVLDGLVISAPQINQGPITGGNAQITGNFDQKSSADLANVLKYGALPLTFTTQAVSTVSPTLGHDQLTGGLIAAAVGMALVILYSLLYYRGLGLIAISSLAVAALLTYESVLTLGRYLGFALSLAGIAGLIVAIGITADSFVVFFERLRDEVREGNTLRAAVERGWKRARRTILVSDTVSFLAAVFLYKFAIGDVRGFAFTLGLTTMIDVVVVFLFTKPMITLAARTKFYGGGHPLSGLDPARLGARTSWRASPRPAPTRGAAAATTRGTQPRTSPKEA
jgi:preprotein translocase subunit SecD